MRLNGGQRVVLCVALGAVMVVLGFALQAAFWSRGGGGGWFNYAPNNGVVFTYDGVDRGAIAGQAAMWLGLVVAWTGLSLLALRSRTGRSSAPGGEGPGSVG